MTAQYAAGKVTIGFSNPYVATYSAEGGTIKFGTPTVLARGVSVQIEPESSDDNNFYADNQIAETDSGRFTGGTTTLTVDGLFIAAKKLIYGLPVAGEDGWTAFGDEQKTPYVSIGFIVKSRSNGNDIYQPIIILKNKFQEASTGAETQGEEIDWQTQELTASTMRSDNSTHDWKWEGKEFESEEEAVTDLKKKMGLS